MLIKIVYVTGTPYHESYNMSSPMLFRHIIWFDSTVQNVIFYLSRPPLNQYFRKYGLN